jgi:hypothetical protein
MAHYIAKESACSACMKGNADQVANDRAADPEISLQSNLWYKYRLTLDEYYALLEAQDHRCAICRVETPTDIRTNRFHVDHDHNCCPGKRSCGNCNRGLLCHACNTALGNLRDDPELLDRAAAYLRNAQRVNR